jgi:aminopeptidase-like protein
VRIVWLPKKEEDSDFFENTKEEIAMTCVGKKTGNWFKRSRE